MQSLCLKNSVWGGMMMMDPSPPPLPCPCLSISQDDADNRASKRVKTGRARPVREAARAIGNLSANVDFAAMFFKLGIVPLMITMLRSADITAARMAAMALSNVATNVKNQPRMVRGSPCVIVGHRV